MKHTKFVSVYLLILFTLLSLSFFGGCNPEQIQLVALQRTTTISPPFHPNSTQKFIPTSISGEIPTTNDLSFSSSPTLIEINSSPIRGTQSPTEFNNKTQESDYYSTNTAIVQELKKTITPQDYQQLLSPNGQYLANFIVLECTNITEGLNPYSLRTIKITDKIQPNTWIVIDQLIYCGGEGSGGILGGLFWSNNSRYFYFTDNWYGEADTNPISWINTAYRYDLLTKETLNLSGLALSIDKLKIAAGDGRDLVVWDLDGGEIARFPGNNIILDQSSSVWLHYLDWSSDNNSIAYILTLQSINNASNTSYILIANICQKQNSLLFVSSNPEFIEVHWIDQNHLSLVGNSNQIYSDWVYDILDKSLTPNIKTTPIP